jgi:hypothetical protein
MSLRGEAVVTLKMFFSHALNFKFHATMLEGNKTQITQFNLNPNLRISMFR